MQKVKITVCLILSFFFSFLTMTALSDYLAKQAGFYDLGEKESAEVENG